MNIIKSLKTCLLLFAVSGILLLGCSKDDDAVQGSATIEITDAPIDNANVSGAFVTVSEIKVDGQTWSGFSGKKTIDLLAYQNGNTTILANGQLDVGAYSNVELVLDYASDADGNAPGCYILTTDNTKADLNSTSSSTGSVVLNSSNFDVSENSSSTFVVDFDLRKSIRKESGDRDYKFKSDSKLQSALRFHAKSTTGTISGTVSGSAQGQNRVVVYAYKQGQFSTSEASGDANSQFEGAVTSASVNANGSYQLSFLEEGDYELVFCNYDDTNNDGNMELTGKLSLSVLGSLNLGNVSVSSQTTATVDVSITGIGAF